MIIPSARHRAVKPRTCQVFIACTFFWIRLDANEHYSKPVQASGDRCLYHEPIAKGYLVTAAGSARSSAAAIEAYRGCRRQILCRETLPGPRVWCRLPVLTLLPR